MKTKILEKFNEFFIPVKQASHDMTNNEYMTDLEHEVVDFDEVKRNYIASLNKELDNKIDEPKSIDAIYVDNRIMFIEFKNGKLNNQDMYEICEKIYDSLLIFTDKMGLTISDLRNDSEFILVINSGLKSIHNSVGDYGKNKIISHKPIFKFENYCFKEVRVLDKKDFDKLMYSYSG